MAKEKKERKPRQKRVLSEEAREKLRAHLAKARKRKKPPEYKNVHPYVMAKDEDDSMSFIKVKEWITLNKEEAKEYTKQSKARGLSDKQRNEYLGMASSRIGYVRWLEHYLKTSEWIGDNIGEKEDEPVIRQCIAMAYYPDGTPKRTVGVYYRDIRMVWQKGMVEQDYTKYCEDGRWTPPTEKEKMVPGMTDKEFTSDLG